MKTIAFLINEDPRDSISGYAMTVYDVLKTSNKYNYKLVPFAPGKGHWHDWLNNLDVDGIIYNWWPGNNRLQNYILDHVNIPQFIIGGHNHIPEFTNIKHVWSAYIDQVATDNVTPLPRPVVYYPDLQYSPPSGRIKIGSFGLGFRNKNYPKIVELVNKQFSDMVVDLNFHMSYTNMSYAETNKIAQTCRELAMPNVMLNITFDYLKTSYDIAKFLNGNDLNVFAYEDEPHLKVTSSSLDHALSARKPIALSRSSYFSHMKHVPGIWLEDRSLRDILNDGIAPLESVYNIHSREAMLDAIETPLNKYVL
jgi:hypothetical protein